MPADYVLAGFCLLAAMIALRMWLSANRTPENANWVRASDFNQVPVPDLVCTMNQSGHFELRPRCVSGLLIGGLGVGLLSGLFGVSNGCRKVLRSVCLSFVQLPLRGIIYDFPSVV